MRKFLVVLAMSMAVVAAASGAASAGGWAVVSLDATPALRAGVPTDVGFTILRHGVTPENSEGVSGSEIKVVLTAVDGTQTRFDVEQVGAVGHHVATITVPAAGIYDWRVTGPFMDAELGSIDAAPASGGDGGSSPAWPIVQWGTAAFAVTMGALAVSELMRSRRRPLAA